MVGFSLKKTASQPKKAFGGFSLKKQPAEKPRPSMLLGGETHKETDDKVAINTFDEHTLGNKPDVLVIRPKSNRDWRADAIKQRDDEDKQLQYGLNKLEPSPKQKTQVSEAVEASDDKSAEELARESLLTGKSASKNVIVAETDLNKELDDMPEPASLEAYEKVPVEEFGAALLRGMGWKEESRPKREVPHTKRVPLLGIGAKALPGMEEVRIESYSPVVKKDKKTGELVDDRVTSRERERSPVGRTDNYRERT